MKNLLFFVLYLLINPRLLWPAVRGLYLPVYIQYEWLKKKRIRTVIDVGAYRGRVTKVLSDLFPKAKIYAFEPSDEIDSIFHKGVKNVTVVKSAVGETNGYVNFYETEYAPASSLLEFGSFYKGRFKISKRKKVKVVSLDSYFTGKKFLKPIFLKIDTQGAEGLVLKGSQKLLKKVSIIHVESPFEELYRGQSFFEDIYAFLIKRGFKYVGNIPDAQFYPLFKLPKVVNSIYINTKLVKTTET